MTSLLPQLKACADPTRVRLLVLLEGGELPVTHLTDVIKQSQPRVSRHLKLLVEAGLLERHKEGAWVFFRLTREAPVRAWLDPILAQARADQTLTGRDSQRLAELKEDLARGADLYFARQAADWDRVRSLHISDGEVEAAVVAAFDGRQYRALLDIGTGTGRMLEVLGDMASGALGLDLNREMLKFARIRLAAHGFAHCQVREGDMYALPLDDGSFDAIVIHQVLHYADAPHAAIREAARVLAPGGRLVLVDFAPHTHEELRSEHAHRRLGFPEAQIHQWLTDAGLVSRPAAALSGGELTVMVWQAEKQSGTMSEAA